MPILSFSFKPGDVALAIHSNRTVLDAIQESLTTTLKTAYDQAVTDDHTHSNKATLDLISEAFTSALKSAYDGAVVDEHTHVNKTTLDAIEQAFTTALKSGYDTAAADAHVHANITVLDAIQEALTTSLKSSYDDAVSKKHTQGTDQGLDTGGANAVVVTDVKDAISKKHSASGQFNQAVAAEISALTSKTTPVDNDPFLVEDSANSFSKIKVLWSAIKSTLKSYFDTIYTLANLGGVPTTRQVNGHALSADVTVTKSDVSLGNVTNDIQAKVDFSGYTEKGTPIDADTLIINDSAASGAIKKSLWSDIKATLKTYFDGIYQTTNYGVSWNESTDVYVRTGTTLGQPVGQSLSSQYLPVQNKMRRCLVLNDGTVNYYLSDINSALKEDGITASVLTGADGQVMVEIPKFWFKHSYSGTTHTWEVSPVSLPDFKVHPAFLSGATELNYVYIGAYEAIVYSAAQSAYIDYTSAYTINPAADIMSSVTAKKPVTNMTRANFRQMANRRGTGWTGMLYDILSAIQLLYLTEYASFYSQNVIGAGISNVTDWVTYNNYYPIAPSGNSNSIGNATGNTAGSTSCATEASKYISYRGIENWYGHIWKWLDGININNNLSYVCNVVANLADDTKTYF